MDNKYKLVKVIKMILIEIWLTVNIIKFMNRITHIMSVIWIVIKQCLYMKIYVLKIVIHISLKVKIEDNA